MRSKRLTNELERGVRDGDAFFRGKGLGVPLKGLERAAGVEQGLNERGARSRFRGG
jgi:hypothetical protein